MPSPTEQDHYARLLEKTLPLELREALTQLRGLCRWCGAPKELRRHNLLIDGCVYEAEDYRVPLPIAEAHVALERWCIEQGWLVEIGQEGVNIRRPWGKYHRLHGHTGADIFEAVSASLKEA